MTSSINWQPLCKQIEQVTQKTLTKVRSKPIAGGCINSTYLLQSVESQYFVKLNQKALLPMFQAEFKALEEIQNTHTIRVPQPILSGILTDQAFLVLEYIPLHSNNHQTDRLLGIQLAALHQIKQPFYGWHQTNTIGSTTQPNPSSSDWISFWQQYRLGYQLQLAEKKGGSRGLIQAGEKLLNTLALLFNDKTLHPSLLHGDLWSGNAASTDQNEPVIYDPASYYGDREADIAMTELFGGFSADFYAAYNDAFPLHDNYSTRKILYNLYHVLNHFNLFGGGYQHQAQQMIDRLNSEFS